MKFVIIGSGGCVCTPKPLCQCMVCVEARKKGYPYARCGCSLYLEDIALLIDTPEDIAIAINNANLQNIDYIMYSHCDTDHTLGMRIMEQLRLEWLDYYDNMKPNNPITVYAQKDVMEDINAIRSKYGPLLEYYEDMALIKRCVVEVPLVIGSIHIAFVPVAKDRAVTAFVFESDGKKLVYAPCDCAPMPYDEKFRDADVLIVGDIYLDGVLKNGKKITPEHPLSTELQSINEIMCFAEAMHIKKVVITHIKEIWGKSYDDYIAIEKQYTNLKFAFDHMVVEL